MSPKVQVEGEHCQSWACFQLQVIPSQWWAGQRILQRPPPISTLAHRSQLGAAMRPRLRLSPSAKFAIVRHCAKHLQVFDYCQRQSWAWKEVDFPALALDRPMEANLS